MCNKRKQTGSGGLPPPTVSREAASGQICLSCPAAWQLLSLTTQGVLLSWHFRELRLGQILHRLPSVGCRELAAAGKRKESSSLPAPARALPTADLPPPPYWGEGNEQATPCRPPSVAPGVMSQPQVTSHWLFKKWKGGHLPPPPAACHPFALLSPTGGTAEAFVS